MDLQVSQAYHRDVSKVALLSRQEEQALARKMRRGDAQARERLICANLRFAMLIAAKYRGMVKDHSDIVQAANVGLIMAVDKYKSSPKVRLISYAKFWISEMIRRMITTERNMVHVAVGAGSKLRTARSHGYEGGTEGVEPRVAQAASIKGFVQLDEVRGLRSDHDPERDAKRSEAASIANKYLARLTKQQRVVLVGRCNGKILSEIAAPLSLSKERIRQVEAMALKRVRAMMEWDRIDVELEALVREIENAA